MSASALRDRGVEVVFPTPISLGSAPKVDLIHAFGADPSVWNMFRHWTRNRVPLVVSPVLVFDSLIQTSLERVVSRLRLGLSNTANMRRTVVRSASRLVALHAQEAEALSHWYGVDVSRITIVSNGSAASASVPPEYRRSGFVVVGTISSRKRQLDLVRAWRPEFPPLSIIGSVAADWVDSAAFTAEVDGRPNVTWHGALPQVEVWERQARSIGCISASKSEGESLAILDSLRLGTPVLIQQGQGSGHLAARYSGGVREFNNLDEMARLISTFADASTSSGFERPPSWDDVGDELLSLYRSVLAAQ
ncbi:glycosyltransferase [Rhodococcus pyridinivorans]